MLSQETISQIMRDVQTLTMQAEALMDAALKAGGNDNISLILLEIQA